MNHIWVDRETSCGSNVGTAPSFGLSLPYGCNLLYLHFGHSFTPSIMSWSVYIPQGSQYFDTDDIFTSKNYPWTGTLKRKSKERCKSYVLVFSSGFLHTNAIPPLNQSIEQCFCLSNFSLNDYGLIRREIR